MPCTDGTTTNAALSNEICSVCSLATCQIAFPRPNQRHRTGRSGVDQWAAAVADTWNRLASWTSHHLDINHSLRRIGLLANPLALRRRRRRRPPPPPLPPLLLTSQQPYARIDERKAMMTATAVMIRARYPKQGTVVQCDPLASSASIRSHSACR